MADVPKIVIERLANGVAAREGHPDANLMSAFVERALADKDRLQVLGHLAGCAECREAIALSFPETIATQEILKPVSAPRFSWPVLRWGAAIACVVVVGAAVTLRQREKMTDQTHSDAGMPAAQSLSAGSAATASPNNSSPLPTEPSVQTAPRSANAGVHAAGRGGVNNLIPGRAKDDLSGSAVSSAPLIAGDTAMNSPRTPRWALTADGSLQRSFDMGRTWEPVAVSLETSLRSVSASGFDIWVGGTNGALYHSADAGDHWMKIQPVAEGQPLTSDVIEVQFASVEEGRLNTASGEVWTTLDGGSTWRARTTKPSASALADRPR